MSEDRENTRVANVRYGHGLGWSFTLLNGKKPVLKGWQAAPRETLEQALAWAAQGNVGLRTGAASGVVAVDKDPQGQIDGLPETVTTSTGREGAFHYYFADPGGLANSAGRLAAHVDVRADGGQVVFPGSVHPETGKGYEWVPGKAPWEIGLARLPQHIIDRLRGPAHGGPAALPASPAGVKMPPEPVPAPSAAEDAPKGRADARAARSAASRAERYARQALRLELNNVHNSVEGNRNDTLNRAAFSMGTLIGGGCLGRVEVEEALRQAALAVGLDQAETEATIRSGIESGMKQPRQPGTSAEAPAIPERQPGRPEAPPSLPPGRFAFDLYGNADRFVHLFGQDVHWCDQHGRWYVWNGKCWKADAIRDVYRMAERTVQALAQECRNSNDDDAMKWAAKCIRDGKAAREMLEVVKHRRAVPVESLDQHPWLLGVDNGIIDLHDGKLLPHDRKYLITSLSPARYQPDAQCPRWMQFLAEIMAGNQAMMDALQRLAGYFLTGDISVQILPILHGPGSNGKNVFLDTLMGIMGPFAEEAPDGLLTIRQGDEHPTEIADLYGKRLVVASETEEGRKMRIGLVKKITGNRYLKGRFMRQDYFQFARTHKTVLVTNNRPIVSESSNAIWRRLRLIPFTVTIPEAKQDRHLTDRLVAEWPGILAWAVRGCLDWQHRQCDLEFPEAVKRATEEYRADSDHVADFIAECCVDWGRHEDQNLRTPKERVYLAYCSWCRSVGEDVLTRNAFNSRLRIHGFEDKTAKMPGSVKAQKCWLNLTLKGESDDA
jgi:putative DNA primase/helicase